MFIGRSLSKKTLLIYGSLASCVFMVLALMPLHFNQYEYSLILFAFGVFSSVEVLVFDVAAKLFNGRSAGTAASLTNFILMMVTMLLQPLSRGQVVTIPAGLFLAFVLSVFVYRESNAG